MPLQTLRVDTDAFPAATGDDQAAEALEDAPAPEPGGPGCGVDADCAGNWAGADCVAGICYTPKHRYLSIDPSGNSGWDTAIKVEVAEMRRFVVDPRRAGLVDEDFFQTSPRSAARHGHDDVLQTVSPGSLEPGQQVIGRRRQTRPVPTQKSAFDRHEHLVRVSG